MSRKAIIKLVIAASCLSILLLTVLFYNFYTKKSHENIVMRFWQSALENKMDEAKFLTSSSDNIRYHRLPGVYGVGSPNKHLDGTEIDWVYREEIYNSQIKIIRFTEFKKSVYRSGVRVETTDKNERKLEYIACLGESVTDSSWKVIKVTLSNVYDKPETIEAECFEKPKQ
jgi:hypothetical protein